MSVPASKKLWRISKEASGIYYEIKLDGIVIDRIKVEEPVLKILKELTEISNKLKVKK